MIFDKSMSTIQLLEFGEETSSNVSGSLEGTEEGLDRLLPGFNVLASGCGCKGVGFTEAGVGVNFSNDIEGLHHDKIVLWNFLSNE